MLVVLVLLAGLGGGCGPTRGRNPVPEGRLSQAIVPGLPATVRTWGDEVSDEFVARCYGEAIDQRRAWFAKHPEMQPKTFDILCISGGGEDGAFGAGLLTGWTDSGRPEFMQVTGISTGALAAPMAFLGKPYDQRLKDAYTQISQRDIYEPKSIFSILRSDSAVDNTPLVRLLEKYIDQEMLDKIAVEHRKGRRLLVGTTNLDAQRPVIWDMGAIAASDYPQRLELFRKILRASASIPAVFSPVYLDVEVEGKRYEEMHVDGVATSQVFLFGQGVDMEQVLRLRKVQAPWPTRVFVIRNSRLLPEWEPTKAYVTDIAKRSILTLTKSQGRGDVLRLYAVSRWSGYDFNLAYMPETFGLRPREPFEREYMNTLYKVGYEMGRKGYRWSKVPPREWRAPAAASRPATMPLGADEEGLIGNGQ